MSLLSKRPKPLALIIIEGWGVAPAGSGNAITEATPAYFNELIGKFPATVIEASGLSIGLSKGDTGSTRRGCRLIGRGAIDDSTFNAATNVLKKNNKNKVLSKIISSASSKKRLHLISLLSTSEAESSLEHLKSFIALIPNDVEILIHGILDGRDAPTTAGKEAVAQLETYLNKDSRIKLATLCGRLYALDQLGNKERVAKAWRLLSSGEGSFYPSAEEALTKNYSQQIFDEEFPPTVLLSDENSLIKQDETVVFLNHKGFSQRNLGLLMEKEHGENNIFYLRGTDKNRSIVTEISEETRACLGTVLAEAGLKQIRLGDSESYSVVTEFFDDGRTDFISGLESLLLPLDQENFMSDPDKIAKAAVEAIDIGAYDFMAIAFSSVDRAAHSGDIEKTKTEILAVDEALKKIIRHLLDAGGAALITSSHGIAERTVDLTGGRSAHTVNPVPFLIIAEEFEGRQLSLPEPLGGDLSILQPTGTLIDIAPTILSMLRLPVPSSMNGKSFI
ncbi:MAG: hypothetical protein QY321_03525 [Patescibacteria group bacterium]|nr:MAG: hypothetical protein QY321_03525 [Patescibacteria group bacterium]